ncbi:hypothetical protein KZO34_09615 [Marinobacter sp. F4206]|nr:hypothetical protein [Marinobacter sp. F4206]
MSSQFVAAQESCQQSARTDLERLYCEVIAEGAGQGLPSQADFRRNEPQVQALLLRGPARRLGLQVPDADSATGRSASSTAPSPATRASEPAPEPETTPPAGPGRLADCRLQAERIVCPDRHFDLALNRPNSELAPGVLDRDNRLGLSSFDGDRTDEPAVRRYLSRAYDRYIPKMVGIGLGANTMSFTAFYNAFQTLEAGGVDFATRMERTFQLLKQDKQTLAVKARYHQKMPETLSLCDAINRDIIVCDDVATNWVFVSPAR